MAMETREETKPGYRDLLLGGANAVVENRRGDGVQVGGRAGQQERARRPTNTGGPGANPLL
eukprot:841142-Lingulodinium_polyedra.AAC.1